ncbi:hypothetical protein PABG_05477 [Paracoccidioides brasiliensis Pb03]|nr:hypothetical protein PABG_05477 [Paracoccidioides brasiliensis Pb03]
MASQEKSSPMVPFFPSMALKWMPQTDDPSTDPIYKENVDHRDAHRREIVRIL